MPRSLTPVALAAAALPCGLVAWNLDADAGRGTLLGYLVGAGLAGLSFAWQRHQWRYRPERALRAQLEGFGLKLGGLVASLLVVRALDAAHVDLRAYLLGYAAAVALSLPLLAVDASRMLRGAGRSA